VPIKDPEKRRQYDKAYREAHRAEAYARVKAWREANPDKVAEQHKRYAEKHPNVLRAKALRHRVANIESVRAKDRAAAAEFRVANPELIKQRKAEYSKRRRLVVNEAVARRKAAKLLRVPCWIGPEERWLMREAYELAALRTKMLGFQWHVDHVIPLQGALVSGLHVPSNLQVIPALDNVRKKNHYEVV